MAIAQGALAAAPPSVGMSDPRPKVRCILDWFDMPFEAAPKRGENASLSWRVSVLSLPHPPEYLAR